MKNRIYFLDHLRTFAIFLVVVVHAGLVYEWTLDSMWIVSDPVKNNNIGLIRMYLDLIVMFTIFFVSGYFIPYFGKKEKCRWIF
jgi:peptidoglycan/LPS O-acetylase OafA/YrhL